MQAHPYYAPSTLESSYLSRYYPHCMDDDGYVDEDLLWETRGEFFDDVATSVAEAVQCNDMDDDDYWYEDLFSLSSPPHVPHDNDASSTSMMPIEDTTTTAMAQTVRFVLRCVGSGLVVDADAVISSKPMIRCPHVRPCLVVVDGDEDDDAEDSKTADDNQCVGERHADVVLEEELSTAEENGAPSFSSFRLYPRCVGRPSQEWTMVSTAATRGEADYIRGETTTSNVQLINMSTMQRLVCSHDLESSSHLQLLTPRQYRKAMEKVDAAWTLSSEGTILSSSTGLALTDDGAGNLTLRPPSSHSLSVEQQWQLIPIV